jgi:hypothetical protein
MTPEQALLKLLEGTVIEYEKLKFTEEGKEIHPEILIAMACMDRGWDLAIPKTGEELQGMIVGTGEYVSDILNKVEFAQALKFSDKDKN